jgi:hypothetical protein
MYGITQTIFETLTELNQTALWAKDTTPYSIYVWSWSTESRSSSIIVIQFTLQISCKKFIASENAVCRLFVNTATAQSSSLFLQYGDNVKTESRLREVIQRYILQLT